MSILIKQIPDDYSELTGLAKYNRSRMPGCFDIFQANLAVDGSYITGLTEDEEKDLTQKLHKDVSKNSDFWSTFTVIIKSDEEREFQTLYNPLDKLSVKMLIANGYLAPSKESVSDSRYLNASYYAYSQETKDNEEINDRSKRDEAISKLFEIKNNKERMVLYGQYLEGLTYHNKLGEATLYKMLRSYIENTKSIDNAFKFLEVYEKPVAEIMQKIIIDKAIKQRLISTARIGKKSVYQYGQVTIGNSLKEVYINLGKPEFAPELLSIKEELDKK